jgi:hypothetical protein
VLLLVDFEKGFDTIKWKFLHKILRSFNFGQIFERWIKIIYNNIRSTVINNGYFSPYFKLQQRMRQGCPISAYLFILVVEILAICIRSNKNMLGLKFISKVESIPVVMDVLNDFYICSGLKANIDKTQIFMIGKHIYVLKKPIILNRAKVPLKC